MVNKNQQLESTSFRDAVEAGDAVESGRRCGGGDAVEAGNAVEAGRRCGGGNAVDAYSDAVEAGGAVGAGGAVEVASAMGDAASQSATLFPAVNAFFTPKMRNGTAKVGLQWNPEFHQIYTEAQLGWIVFVAVDAAQKYLQTNLLNLAIRIDCNSDRMNIRNGYIFGLYAFTLNAYSRDDSALCSCALGVA